MWLGSTPEPWLKGVRDPYDGVGANPYHHWSYDLTLASATAKLGSLVKGQLVGIAITRHGLSPRVVSAQVVGTRGHANVTGPQLQSIFGLPSTYMAFTTITSSPGMSSGPRRQVVGHGRQGAAEIGFEGLAIHGRVFPAGKGAMVSIQLRTGRRWKTVRHVRVARDGSYAAWLPKAGSYRAMYRHVPGPAVGVG